ncbi:MAG: beta-galactosidase trimerization domain-containing protein, partial [Planctomycetota bacterium]
GHAPWTSLLQGMHGFGYWAGIFLMDPNSNMIQPLQPDLRTTDFARWSNVPVERIRLGLHRLAYAGRFDDSGIAILYSRASQHATTAWRGRHFRNPLARSLWPETEAVTIGSLLHQVGYQYSRISDEQIRDGLLQRSGVKLLVLPVSQAVSPEAAEAIRRFVTAGGTVLADVRPAVVTRHGVRHGARGALDDVFGIEQDTAWSAFDLAPRALKVKLGNHDATTAPAAVTGSDLKTAGARALVQSDVPVMLVNRVGRGHAVLLNTLVSRLGGASRPVLDDVLARAGIDPLFKVTRLDGGDGGPAADDPDDGMFGNAEGFMDALAGAATRPVLYRHVLGGADLVGLSSNRQRHGAGTTTLEVTWPRPGHVYDVVDNTYLGRHATGTISKPAEGVAVFVVVPHRIEKPTVALRQRPDRLGRPVLVVDITATTDGSWQRALQVKLVAPKDTVEPIVDTVLCTDGAARFDAVLPMDAPRGTWTVTVTDAVSAEAVTTRFTLE